MRYRLHTLLIVLALGPPLFAVVCKAVRTPELWSGISATGIAMYAVAWIGLIVFWRLALPRPRGSNT
jgi:hypothetical protein